ncbi:MAG: carboxypeptidase-like regulatory domain-containing protein [Cyclobacteriaceae bacterium]
MKITAALFSLAFAFTSFAQSVQGVLIDRQSNEAIPFAHVKLGASVSVTNFEGEFIIQRPSVADSILSISFVGYHSREINIDVQRDYKIYMEPAVMLLEPVRVLTGDVLMGRVFSKMLTNYDQENQRMTSYYKEKLSSDDSLCYLAEGVMDIFRPSWFSKEEVKINPLRTRKKVIREINEDQVTLIGGHAFDMIVPSVWRKDSFLDTKNRDAYEFIYEGKMAFGEHDIYLVSFQPKSKKGYVSGRLYVEDETYAIIKMEYEPQVSKKSFWSWVRWTEEYEQVEGVYQLTRVSYDGEWLEYGKILDYSALLVNNKMATVRDAPEMKAGIRNNGVFFEEASYDFTGSFWTGFNYIKLTRDEKDL